tara:strand:+ start:4051 stop:4314 length:264 start_codon:yes stop_codon:yes gene_type:complete
MNNECMIKLYKNLKMVDEFFGSLDYQNLLKDFILQDIERTKLIEKIALYDDSITFFSNKKEFKRCYIECRNLLKILSLEISEKYKPI